MLFRCSWLTKRDVSKAIVNDQKTDDPNGYHSLLKNMVNHRFRGVSTKYLNNYLVNFSKGTDKIKEDAMFSFTLPTKCSRRYVDIPGRAPIPLL